MRKDVRMEEIGRKGSEMKKPGRIGLGESDQHWRMSESQRGGARCTRGPAGQTGSVAVRMMKLRHYPRCVLAWM